MRRLFYAFLGFTDASCIAWFSLFMWAYAALGKNDSYWDRIPGGADTFFTVWLFVSIVTGIGTAWWSRRPPVTAA
jgi:hypothetical protein